MDSSMALKAFMEAFSENLIRLRKNKFGTMDEVALNSKFDSSNYNKFEKGKGNPTVETILKIASLLEVNPKELFDFDFDIKEYKNND